MAADDEGDEGVVVEEDEGGGGGHGVVLKGLLNDGVRGYSRYAVTFSPCFSKVLKSFVEASKAFRQPWQIRS